MYELVEAKVDLQDVFDEISDAQLRTLLRARRKSGFKLFGPGEPVPQHVTMDVWVEMDHLRMQIESDADEKMEAAETLVETIERHVDAFARTATHLHREPAVQDLIWKTVGRAVG